eukprot:gene6982-52_t
MLVLAARESHFMKWAPIKREVFPPISYSDLLVLAAREYHIMKWAFIKTEVFPPISYSDLLVLAAREYHIMKWACIKTEVSEAPLNSATSQAPIFLGLDKGKGAVGAQGFPPISYSDLLVLAAREYHIMKWACIKTEAVDISAARNIVAEG